MNPGQPHPPLPPQAPLDAEDLIALFNASFEEIEKALAFRLIQTAWDQETQEIERRGYYPGGTGRTGEEIAQIVLSENLKERLEDIERRAYGPTEDPSAL